MLELVYTLILAGAFVFIGWFSIYVVYTLYQGQRWHPDALVCGPRTTLDLMNEPVDRNLTPDEPEPTEGSLADEQQQSPGIHPALEPIAWLVGSWWGFGVGGYPTIDSFRYEQEITFGSDGRPFLR